MILERSCHPTFAMSGALAWQVKKMNKKRFIGFWGDRTGIARGLSLVWCALCYFLVSIIIAYRCSTRRITFLQPTDTPEDLHQLHSQVISISFQSTISVLDIIKLLGGAKL